MTSVSKACENLSKCFSVSARFRGWNTRNLEARTQSRSSPRRHDVIMGWAMPRNQLSRITLARRPPPVQALASSLNRCNKIEGPDRFVFRAIVAGGFVTKVVAIRRSTTTPDCRTLMESRHEDYRLSAADFSQGKRSRRERVLRLRGRRKLGFTAVIGGLPSKQSHAIRR